MSIWIVDMMCKEVRRISENILNEVKEGSLSFTQDNQFLMKLSTQFKRYYNALRGEVVNMRYVFLPHESQGYAAKESILYTLWEMDTWLEKYVKNKISWVLRSKKASQIYELYLLKK